jgi:acyl carrier protein
MYSEKVRNILEKNGRLSVPVKDLSEESDLYDAGLTSLATVSLMLALEDEFDIEIPDNMLSRKTFESIASIIEVVEELDE